MGERERGREGERERGREGEREREGGSDLASSRNSRVCLPRTLQLFFGVDKMRKLERYEALPKTKHGTKNKGFSEKKYPLSGVPQLVLCIVGLDLDVNPWFL